MKCFKHCIHTGLKKLIHKTCNKAYRARSEAYQSRNQPYHSQIELYCSKKRTVPFKKHTEPNRATGVLISTFRGL